MAPTPQHRAVMFGDSEADPRQRISGLGDERAVLIQYLNSQRQTLEVKCGGLTAAQLAARSVQPSTMSLLGLVRHMAEVERTWFRRRFAGEPLDKRYQTHAEPDGDFDGALADEAVVAEAWQAWRAEVAFAEQFVAGHDLDFTGDNGRGQPMPLRTLMLHMTQEYARHNGHADLLRERIDGRMGL